jgi:hypothetical protein
MMQDATSGLRKGLIIRNVFKSIFAMTEGRDSAALLAFFGYEHDV